MDATSGDELAPTAARAAETVVLTPADRFLVLALRSERVIRRRVETIRLLDNVTLERSNSFDIDLSEFPVGVTPVPILWARKANAFTARSSDEVIATRLEERHSFSDFSLSDAAGVAISLLTRKEADELVVGALEAAFRQAALDVDTERAKALRSLVQETPVNAWPRVESLVSDSTINSNAALVALLFDAAFSTPLVAALPGGQRHIAKCRYKTTLVWQTRTLKASLGIEPVPLEVDLPRIGMSGEFHVEYEGPEGCEILGAELRAIEAGADREAADSAHPTTDDSDAVRGRQSVRHTTPVDLAVGARYNRLQFIRKAPRRTVAKMIDEWLASRRIVWNAQDRTRFGRRVDLATHDLSPRAGGVVTFWMSFERRSVRPALLATGLVLAIELFVSSRLRLFGYSAVLDWPWKWRVSTLAPLAPWNWSLTGVRSWWHQPLHSGSRALIRGRYDRFTDELSSALVTGLIAPAALVSAILRPGEHQILAQLLRVVRLLLLGTASALLVLALCIATATPLRVFTLVNMGGLAVAGMSFLLLCLTYRNCERMGARPSVGGRMFLWRRRWAQRRAENWLRSRLLNGAEGVRTSERRAGAAHVTEAEPPPQGAAPSPAERAAAWWHRRREGGREFLSRRALRKAGRMNARLGRPPQGSLPRGDSLDECLELARAIVRDLSSSQPQAAKQHRNLPLTDPNYETLERRFSVRLTRVDCLEVESLAAALPGLSEAALNLSDGVVQLRT